MSTVSDRARQGDVNDHPPGYHERITTLQTQYQKLQDQLDHMDLDKLDGTISHEHFARISETFRTDQANLLRQIAQHPHANQSYPDDGMCLLELAQKAVALYGKRDVREKRKWLDGVCPNS